MSDQQLVAVIAAATFLAVLCGIGAAILVEMRDRRQFERRRANGTDAHRGADPETAALAEKEALSENDAMIRRMAAKFREQPDVQALGVSQEDAEREVRRMLNEKLR